MANQALSSSAARILGFESAADWAATSGTKALSLQRVQGQHSLGLSGIGYSELKSQPLDSLGQVGNSVSVDLQIPTQQPNPWWYGTISLRVDVPSKGLYSVGLGSHDLNGTTPGAFRRFTFALSTQVRDKLRSTYSDARFTVILNVPSGGGTYLVDRLDVGVSSSPPGPTAVQCEPGGRCLLSFQVPRGLPLPAARFVAGGSLTLADRSRVRDDAGAPGAVASAALELGVEASTGSAFAVGNVVLRDRARIEGDLRTTGTITLANGATVSGQTTSDAQLKPLTTYSWSVPVPAPFSSGQVVPPDGSAQLSPGGYEATVVNSRATLSLSSGTYFFRSLSLEPQAKLRLSQADGPVYIYVLEQLTYRGAVTTSDGSVPQLLVGYLGVGDVSLEATLTGTVVAPNARLSLGMVSPMEFEGSFFARELRTGPDTKLKLRPSLVNDLAGDTLSQCAQGLTLDSNLPEPLRTRQYNLDLLRFCLAPGIDECEARVVATANADRHALALQFLSKAIDAPEQLAVTRDITRKVHRLQRNPALMAQYCEGDADGDRVPDAVDQCAGTPPLKATDDAGCVTTDELPRTVPRGVIDAHLSRMGIFYDPKCSDAKPPVTPTPVFCSVLTSGQFGTAVLAFAQPIPIQELAPNGCEVWFEVEVFKKSTRRNYKFAFEIHEPSASPLDWTYRHINTSHDSPGDRGEFARAMIAAYNDLSTEVLSEIAVRARTTNGNGIQSQWSSTVPMRCGDF